MNESISNYYEVKIVGEGNFSIIHLYEDKESKQQYAIKVINKKKLLKLSKEDEVVMEKHCLSKLNEFGITPWIFSTF